MTHEEWKERRGPKIDEITNWDCSCVAHGTTSVARCLRCFLRICGGDPDWESSFPAAYIPLEVRHAARQLIEAAPCAPA